MIGLLSPGSALPPRAPERQQTEILFLSFSDPALPDTTAMVEEVQTQILEGRSTPIHFNFEYLDPSVPISETSEQQRLVSYLREKYQEHHFRLIIAIGEQALIFLEESRAKRKLFPDSALVFAVVDPTDPRKLSAAKTARTGVIRTSNFLATLQTALGQNPGTRQVIVISGSSDLEKREINTARSQFSSYESNVAFRYWTNLTFGEVGPRLATVEPNSVVLFFNFLSDAAGEQFVPAQILPSVASASPRPVYGTYASFVGQGVVGGSVADLREVGKIVGQQGLRVLNGEKPENIPVVKGEFQRYAFDWRQLQRWRIPRDLVPAQSTILYWESSAWDQYGWRIVGLIAAILIEALLIVLLLQSRASRNHAENTLRQKQEELSEAQRIAQLGSWQWDPATDVLAGSSTLYNLLGLDPSSPTFTIKALSAFLSVQGWEMWSKSAERCLQTGAPYELQLEARRPDGSTMWVAVRGESVRDESGRVHKLRGTIQDTTEIAREVRDRKRVEEELRKSEEKFSKAFRHSPLAITLTSARTHQYLDVNDTYERLTGFKREEVVGRSALEIGLWVNPAERKEVTDRLLSEGSVHETEYRFRTKDGRILVGLASAELIEIQGEPCVLGVVADVTSRLQTEQALAESERRFRLMADSAPVLMWMAGNDKLCTDFNKEWLRFTGRTMEQELGEGWTENVHPDDRQRCLRAYELAFDTRRQFTIEYRLRRHDGHYRSILDRGVPRFLEDGSFAGYVGCCIDVTEEKEAKAIQRELSGRLIHAQEEERARIARELHDDVNQRLALLANGLQGLQQMFSDSDEAAQGQVRELWQLTSEVANDLQHLSHQLHPSKLHYLGLSAAVRDLCHEFSKAHKIEVECSVQDPPSSLDQDVSLTLYRIVQESLRNVAKHSRARHVKVELTPRSKSIQLRVSDDGVGFSGDHIGSSHGLGLVSMRERLRLAGGELSIWSRPSLGTQVEAAIPLAAERARSAKADLRAS
jgi:PAS domain S-box-containing protein